ncbi:hypothetical protein [Luteimonas sp. 3794]|uniref:hypothetical protein n=1 Tax=Luteimonas sp. 3794 TaxID=2817730 RepID=UPI0028600E15|nr:hypothetical protein [Luteimonas sp. 3794]MDR6991180.1 hypothetical protein [Luteimonas sp. 3794]
MSAYTGAGMGTHLGTHATRALTDSPTLALLKAPNAVTPAQAGVQCLASMTPKPPCPALDRGVAVDNVGLD